MRASSPGSKPGEHHEVHSYPQRTLKLGGRQPVPLPPQPQLGYRQWSKGLRASRMAELSLIQTHQLPINLLPVQQLMQLHRLRVFHQRLRFNHEETGHRERS